MPTSKPKTLPATFSYTGTVQPFVVPVGVTSIGFTVVGASGGYDNGPYGSGMSNGGYGGIATGQLMVTPGSTLYIVVGGQGLSSSASRNPPSTLAGGYNGGGQSGCSTCTSDGGSGGGATDIRTSPSDLASRLVVAGGGGGADGDSGKSWPGGNGGGLVGDSVVGEVQGGVATDAFGGSQTSGGLASSCVASPLNTGGTLGNGETSPAGGGGGGGYYGGGGGCSSGGAGGSGYCDATVCASVVYSVASSFGAGSVTLSVSKPIAGTISTIAGTGVAGYFGDGGLAINAQLNSAQGVFLDRTTGNPILYIADSNNNVVRKVDANGIISTVSFGGLNLDYPRDVVVDVSGNIYVSSWNSYYVAIKTATTATVFACSAGNYGYSGDNGPATSALCRRPLGMAVASNGDLYFADFNNDVVRLVKRVCMKNYTRHSCTHFSSFSSMYLSTPLILLSSVMTGHWNYHYCGRGRTPEW